MTILLPAWGLDKRGADLTRSPVLPCYRRIQKAVNVSAAGSSGVESGGRGNTVMTLSRALPFALALAVIPLWPAAAQFGGMPGGAFSAPQAPPPACQQLLSTRDEVNKHGAALKAAGEKKAPPDELCKLFKAFVAVETKMIKGLQEHSATCGVPPEVIKQVKEGHGKASEMSKKICDVAAQGPRQAGPSLSDALGTTPLMPDASATKKGSSTFDTLTGSPLSPQ